MDFSKLLTLIKPSPKHYTALALVSGLIVFLPDRVLEAIGLDGFRLEHRGRIGFVFLLAVALVISEAGALVARPVRAEWRQRRTIWAGKKH